MNAIIDGHSKSYRADRVSLSKALVKALASSDDGVKLPGNIPEANFTDDKTIKIIWNLVKIERLV